MTEQANPPTYKSPYRWWDIHDFKNWTATPIKARTRGEAITLYCERLKLVRVDSPEAHPQHPVIALYCRLRKDFPQRGRQFFFIKPAHWPKPLSEETEDTQRQGGEQPANGHGANYVR